MNPFKKILVPYDFSDPSKYALHSAADVARRYEAPITLMHVCDSQLFSVPESYLLYDASRLPQFLASLEKQLETVKHELMAVDVMQVQTQVVQGSPYAEIVRHAADGLYDLIVMGTHGRTGLAHALMGSVAERVVRTAPCAVLTVRRPTTPTAR